MKQSFSPCDECSYSYSKNNQETGMCDICEFKKMLGGKSHCEIIIFPMHIGDTVFVDSKTISVDKMNYEKTKPVSQYFSAKVISFKVNSRGRYFKLLVKGKWICEYFSPECGPGSVIRNMEKYYTYPLSALGKTVFLTEIEAKNTLGVDAK